MKKASISFMFLGVIFGSAFCGETERLEQMSEALQKHSAEDFFAMVRANRWAAPRIPSKWFVDSKVTDDEEKRLSQAARDFGYQLALRLDDLAKEQQTLPQDNALYQRTILLCDLGDWCAGTVGYGNIFLGRRCLDLAAVGLARLTASMEFSLALCERVAIRVQPQWMGAPYRLQVLNSEANTNLFINSEMTETQLDKHRWLARAMLAAERSPELAGKWGVPPPPDPALVNAKAFANSLHLFDEEEKPPSPVTLARSWGCRQHGWLIFWGGSQGYYQALALLKYRSAVGFFPPPFARTEEEIRRRDTEIAEAAKWGRKMTKEEDDPSYDPLREAFRRELAKLDDAKRNECAYDTAAIAYKAVSNNTFFDADTYEAIKWYIKASEQGDKQASERLRKNRG